MNKLKELKEGIYKILNESELTTTEIIVPVLVLLLIGNIIIKQ